MGAKNWRTKIQNGRRMPFCEKRVVAHCCQTVQATAVLLCTMVDTFGPNMPREKGAGKNPKWPLSAICEKMCHHTV